jgi:hypothetical protein
MEVINRLIVASRDEEVTFLELLLRLLPRSDMTYSLSV